MRNIYLLIIALALVSVANQSFSSFGEFIEGHNEDQKRFKIYGTNSRALTNYVKANQVFAIAKTKVILEFQSPCGTWTKSPGRISYVPNRCNRKSQRACHEIRDLLFSKENGANWIWSQQSASFPLRTDKGTLLLIKF